MLPVDEPVWLATFLPLQLLDLGDAEILARHHARGLADIFDHGDGDEAAFVMADGEGRAGIGAHVDLARHHLLHGEIAGRHREFLELDAVLFEQAGAQQVIGRHAPHVGLVALAHRLQRRARGAHAQARRQHAGAGRRQRMPAGNSLLQNVSCSSSLMCFDLAVGCADFSPSRFALASWPRWRSSSFWHSRNSTLSGSRGRGSAILITAFTVPGCGVITTTRSAR